MAKTYRRTKTTRRDRNGSWAVAALRLRELREHEQEIRYAVSIANTARKG